MDLNEIIELLRSLQNPMEDYADMVLLHGLMV